jgi:hypothetical protein
MKDLLDPTISSLSKDLMEMKNTKIESLESVTARLIKSEDSYNPSKGGAPSPTSSSTKLASLTTVSSGRSGHVFRRATGVFRQIVWNRVYMTLVRDVLTVEDEKIDLRICMVRVVEDDREDVFEILNPKSGGILLQAENSSEMREWIGALESAITRVLQGHSPIMKPVEGWEGEVGGRVERELIGVSSGVGTVEVLRTLAGVEGNGVCADCGSSKNVDWVWVDVG